jgi:hypothetical protein
VGVVVVEPCRQHGGLALEAVLGPVQHRHGP